MNLLSPLKMSTVSCAGERTNAAKCDLSKILPEEVEQELKDAAEISMGTEISEEDIMNIKFLCEQVFSLMLDKFNQFYS